MANAKGKHRDNTHLSIDFVMGRGFLHRDYIAHCLRWSHVVKHLLESKRYQTAHVLDVGCGKDLPLPRTMYSSRLTHTTGSYTGVDINKLERPKAIPEGAKFDLTIIGETIFTEAELPRDLFDLVACFEVLEHVEPIETYNILARVGQVLEADGVAFISTPCYDAHVGAADNHVNEMSVEGLAALIGMSGLKVDRRWGTFASQKDYKHLLKERGLQELYEELSAYYDSNVLACVLAPLFPDNARNCLWQLSTSGESVLPEDESILDQRHSSSGEWAKQVQEVIDACST